MASLRQVRYFDVAGYAYPYLRFIKQYRVLVVAFDVAEAEKIVREQYKIKTITSVKERIIEEYPTILEAISQTF